MSAVTIDNSEIAAMAAGSEVLDWLSDEAEGTLTDIFVDLTSPPPIGTPVDTGAARDSWQIDLSGKEVYSTSPYMNRLNSGLSTQSPSGFIDLIVDRYTDA